MPTGTTPNRPASDVILAAAIRQARVAKFWTQADLARELTAASGGDVAVDQSAVSRWESADRRPSLRYLALLVDVLELPDSITRTAA